LTAWVGVIAALIFGLMGPVEVLQKAIRWNFIGIFFGSVILAELFVYSRMPETISDKLINRSKNLSVALMLVIVFASFISVFIDNVVTVLIVAPIALQLTRKAGVSPIPVIIGLAVSSNLQGMAILIGDIPSMLLAAQETMSFLNFFWDDGRLGIFWFVQLGAVVGFAVLWLYIKEYRQKPEKIEVAKIRSWVPFWLIILMVVLLSLSPMFDKEMKWLAGVICLATALVGFIWYSITARKGRERHKWNFHWRTTLFLMAIFILVYMLAKGYRNPDGEEISVINVVVDHLDGLRGENPFVILSIVVWISVMISAFIDNVPYIAAMLPIVATFGDSFGEGGKALLILGLLIGSCMGGNVTPIGAAANVTAMGILEKEGKPVSFWGFIRIGLPFTVAATASAYLALYLVYRYVHHVIL
ncbi:MAG: anion permease, partial [Candidatus Krumholzibacteria bacterium]|nr:anion permease [Candidatus Krumholzibacteria bacterium]